LGQHGAVSGPGGSDGRWTPTDGYADIRCDEDYEAFYRAQLSAGRKLPPPLQLHQRTLEGYSELPLHLQQQQAHQQHQHQLLAARMSAGAAMQHGGAPRRRASDRVRCSVRFCLAPTLLSAAYPEQRGPHVLAGLEPINEQRVSPVNGGAIPPDALQEMMSQLGAPPRPALCGSGALARARRAPCARRALPA